MRQFVPFSLVFLLLTNLFAVALKAPESIDTLKSVAIDTTKNTSLISKATTHDSSDIGQWLEKHHVFEGLIGAIVTALITVFIYRQNKRRAERVKTQAKAEIERRYLKWIALEYGTINLYGFQSAANINVRTLEVFVSLRLSDERWRGENHQTMDGREDTRHLSPEELLQRAFLKKRVLLIIGDPGSGKTTLLKYYAICCIEKKGWQKLGLTKQHIPILVPLLKVDPAKPFSEALSAWATKKNLPISRELFDNWLEKRGALVMLDGLDEISEIDRRKQVCEWIDNACNSYGNSRFIVTSRFSGYRVAEGIELRADHLRANVLDLNPEQQKIFLKKWFIAAYKEEIEASNHIKADEQRDVAHQAEELADAVLQYLARDENTGLQQLAGTPVLLQIMALLWKEYQNLPPGRASLYERCTDYLLDRRDRAKGIVPKLPADQAKIVLRPLALWMQEILRTDAVTAKELEDKIAPLIEEVKSGLKSKDFIENLRDRAGILQEFGEDSYIFRHKSFREFLAAGQLADEVQRDPQRVNVLVENFHDGWWRETLLFALSLPKPVIFSDFFERFLPHQYNGAGFPTLLEQLISAWPKKGFSEKNFFCSVNPYPPFLNQFILVTEVGRRFHQVRLIKSLN